MTPWVYVRSNLHSNPAETAHALGMCNRHEIAHGEQSGMHWDPCDHRTRDGNTTTFTP